MFRRSCVWIVSGLLLSLVLTVPLVAQVTGGGGGTGGGGTGGTGNGGTGVAGIWIDADGVLSIQSRPLPPASRKRASAKRPQRPAPVAELPTGPLLTDDNRDASRQAASRAVSLARLEQAIRPFAESAGPVPADIEYLAGLQRIDAVVALPGQRDILLIGPADGFDVDPWGRGLSASSGTPCLKLEDLVVLLRNSSESELGCSIDPEPSRLADLNRYLRQNNGPSTSAAVKARLGRLDEILGLQNVRTFGLPAESHAAAVFVEADYVMKRVGLGLDRPPVKGFKSHLAMVAPGGNSMQRWWFTPRYEPFVSTDDRTAWSFAGPRVQLLTEQELVDANGRRSAQSGMSTVTADTYARQFNEHFDDLARQIPSFAELRGLFDLTLAVALIRRERWQTSCELPLSLLLDETRLTVAKRPVPKQVHSLMNMKSVSGATIIAQVGGGVSCRPQSILNQAPATAVQSPSAESPSPKPTRAETNPNASVATRRQSLRQLAAALTPPPQTERWWWDLGVAP